MLDTLMGHAARMGRILAPALALFLTATSAFAATHSPIDSTQLTNLLNGTSLQQGDTIILNAGATYVGTFTLADKGSGQNYITIQSSNLASLPASGRRVVQTDSANMPKIVAPNGATSSLAIKTTGAAHHWKFIGIEITGMADNNPQTAAVQIGANDSTQTQLSQVPHHFIFDRCIVRANSGTQALRRAFALNSANTQIINCRIADCKDVGSGDSQAVAIANGPGPYLVDNCFLEAASEHVLVGGSPVQIVDMVVSDLTVTRNHFYKPLAWKTQSWNVKNHFELKAGKHVLLDGNIMENCWHQAGDFKGCSIAIKRIAHADGGNPWTETDNVTISNNIIRHVGLGISLAGSKEADGSWTVAGWPKNVTIRNNLWHDITGSDFWAGNTATFINMGSGGPNTKFDHNTAFIKTTSNASRIAEIWGGPYTGFEFTNNIVNDGQSYNFKSNVGNGEGTFDFYMPASGGGMVYKKNVTADVSSSLLLPNYHGDWGLAPFNNTALAFPVGFSTVLQNFATPGADYSGWKVKSPYTDAGTDGKDIGCDIDQLNAKTAGCISGVWSSSGQVTMDNTDATLTGSWTTSTNVLGFVGLNYYHDGDTGKGTKFCRWTPTLSAGTYDVYARWTSHADRATNSPYSIVHAGGTNIVVVNQEQQNGMWVLLGTYNFNAGTGGYVELGTAGTNGLVIADGVKFVPVLGAPTTITLKNGVDSYTGATSFHVRGQDPTGYYGSSRSYHQANSLIGTNNYVERAFYKFDVSPAASTIPSGATINNAKLKIKVEFRSHTYDYGISCYRMAPASFTVNYANATRNTYNGTNSWTGGANAGDNDHITTPVDNNSTIPAVGQWIEFDVTTAVQAWVSGTANNGLMIKTNTGSSNIGLRLSTPADTNGSAEYPTLEVTYQ